MSLYFLVVDDESRSELNLGLDPPIGSGEINGFNTNLNPGRGNPWAGHVNANELMNPRTSFEPSFSVENLGIEPPIGSK